MLVASWVDILNTIRAFFFAGNNVTTRSNLLYHAWQVCNYEQRIVRSGSSPMSLLGYHVSGVQVHGDNSPKSESPREVPWPSIVIQMQVGPHSAN